MLNSAQQNGEEKSPRFFFEVKEISDKIRADLASFEATLQKIKQIQMEMYQKCK